MDGEGPKQDGDVGFKAEVAGSGEELDRSSGLLWSGTSQETRGRGAGLQGKEEGATVMLGGGEDRSGGHSRGGRQGSLRA